MIAVKAYPCSEPPEANNDYHGMGKCSGPVLIKRLDNSCVVGIFVIIDDVPEWRSCCSNAWDITEEVVCWSTIPKMVV